MKDLWRQARHGWWPAAIALLATVAMTAVTAWSLHQPGLAADSYAHWDSGQYLHIAEFGYSLEKCGDQQNEYPPDAWCGNTGWLPGYPLIVRGLMAVGLRSEHPGRGPAVDGKHGALAGVLVSHLALWLLYWVLFVAVEKTGSRQDAWLVLALAAVFPGSVYYQAVFPVSLFLLAAVVALAAAERDRPLVAGIAGALAAFTYSTGFLLAPVIVVAYALRRELPWPKRLRAMGIAAGLTVAGFVAVLVYQQFAVGRWDAFFLVQEKYGHGLHNPLMTWLRALKGALTPADRLFAANLQTTLIGVAMLGLIAWGGWRFKQLSRLELLVMLYLGAFWLFPLIMGKGVSLTRQESLLLPAVLLVPRLPANSRPWLLAALVLFDVHLTVLFFLDIII